MQAHRREGRGFFEVHIRRRLAGLTLRLPNQNQGVFSLIEDPAENLEDFSQKRAALSVILAQVLANKMGQLSCQRTLNV